VGIDELINGARLVKVWGRYKEKPRLEVVGSNGSVERKPFTQAHKNRMSRALKRYYKRRRSDG